MSDDDSNGRRMRARTIEKWDRWLRRRIEDRRFKTTAEFQEQLHAVMNDVLNAASAVAKVDPAEFRRRLAAKLGSGDSIGTRLDQISGIYIKTRSELSFLRDERRDIDWATTWDHVKFVLYRFFTAIAIAIVILGTAIVAERFQIPIPLLRLGTL